MHELSIALSIVEGVEEELTRREKSSVATVYLRLGPLSGVVKDALVFCYNLACDGTPLAGSWLEIEETPIVLYCTACAHEQPAISVQQLQCIVCGTPSHNVRSGFELEVFALELKEEHATCDTAPAG